MTRKSVWLYVAAFSVVLASVLWATLVMAAPSFQPAARPAAATITVTTIGDTITCGTPCSLRGAILGRVHANAPYYVVNMQIA